MIVLEEIVIEDIKERPQFKAEANVEPGNYLEVTPELDSTNRIVDANEGVLPKTLEEENAFIPVTEIEVKTIRSVHIDTNQYVKKTPGSYGEPGYYVEVDRNGQINHHYILLKKRRFPPTSAKGHRWIQIEKRHVKSK